MKWPYIKLPVFVAVLTIGGLIISPGCNSSEFEPQDEVIKGEEYYPLEIGSYRIYRYDTIVYSGSKRDTFTGYKRYTVTEQYIDSTGIPVFRLEVSEKKTIGEPFRIRRIETVKTEDNRLVESEEGLRFIKLKFPLSKRASWAGNSLFDTSDDIVVVVGGENVKLIKKSADWRYRVVHTDSLLTNPLLGELSALHINQVDDESLIEVRYVDEFYARHIGLVFKKMIILDRTFSTQKPLIEDATSGFVFTLELIEYD